jgi:hypothetical protein
VLGDIDSLLKASTTPMLDGIALAREKVRRSKSSVTVENVKATHSSVAKEIKGY